MADTKLAYIKNQKIEFASKVTPKLFNDFFQTLRDLGYINIMNQLKFSGMDARIQPILKKYNITLFVL